MESQAHSCFRGHLVGKKMRLRRRCKHPWLPSGVVHSDLMTSMVTSKVGEW